MGEVDRCPHWFHTEDFRTETGDDGVRREVVSCAACGQAFLCVESPHGHGPAAPALLAPCERGRRRRGAKKLRKLLRRCVEGGLALGLGVACATLFAVGSPLAGLVVGGVLVVGILFFSRRSPSAPCLCLPG